jgi:integrase
MAGEKLLTDPKCKSAKPKNKVYYLNDGAGLRLRIRPDGSSSWIYRYRLHGKEKNLGIGAYPKLSLADARAKAAENRAEIVKGINPLVAKKSRKAEQAIKEEQTLSTVAKEWLAHNKSEWSTNYYVRNEGLFRRFLLPDLGRLPIDQITESYLFSVLKPHYDRGRKESVRRARSIAAQIFSYARHTHRCTHNPARDMADNTYFKKPPIKHFTAIAQSDVPELIEKLNKTGTGQILTPKTVCGLLLALYTGLRDYSLRAAMWSEIDFEKQIWVVPASRMKSGREHRVPLPKQAITALKNIEHLTFRGPDSYIFASGATKTGHMAENTLRLALHRLGYKVTVHGFRSLITDVLNEKGFNSDAIERQLDHVEKSQVRRAYLRSEFVEERLRMMAWFADWCNGKANANGKFNTNVSALRRSA